VGKAVFRNRIRRRLREIIRLSLDRFPENISVVFNPRRLSHDAPRERLSQEVERLIAFLSR
jgi:ribonuclease P protein component